MLRRYKGTKATEKTEIRNAYVIPLTFVGVFSDTAVEYL